MPRAITALPLLLLALISLPGCVVTSEHPLCDAETATIDEELIGEWIFEDDRRDASRVLLVRRKEGSEHVLELVNPTSDRVELFCTKIGSERYLSFLIGPEPREDYWIGRYVVHKDDTLTLEYLDSKRVATAIRSGEIAGKGLTITATSDEIRSFLEKGGKNCFAPVDGSLKRWKEPR